MLWRIFGSVESVHITRVGLSESEPAVGNTCCVMNRSSRYITASWDVDKSKMYHRQTDFA